jgi:hypothetical protein
MAERSEGEGVVVSGDVNERGFVSNERVRRREKEKEKKEKEKEEKEKGGGRGGGREPATEGRV